MKIVYMGTPDFAVPSLEALVRAGHEVACVVTQPDAVRDRGKKIKYSPVKEKALELGIPVLQPVKVRKKTRIFAADAADRSRSDRGSSIRSDPAKRNPGTTGVWLPECAWFAFTSLSRCCSDSAGYSLRAMKRQVSRSCIWKKVWIPGICWQRRRPLLDGRPDRNFTMSWHRWARSF